jgi:hypothetical protein
LGEVAVDALVATLDHSEPTERTVVLPTELVVRESCGCEPQPESPTAIYETIVAPTMAVS